MHLHGMHEPEFHCVGVRLNLLFVLFATTIKQSLHLMAGAAVLIAYACIMAVPYGSSTDSVYSFSSLFRKSSFGRS